MNRLSRSILVLAPLLLASACAATNPEAHVRNRLMQAGVPEPMAACMARRMVDRLTISQLRRVGDLPDAPDARTVQQFLHRIRALGDPEIVAVSTSSAAICAVGLDG